MEKKKRTEKRLEPNPRITAIITFVMISVVIIIGLMFLISSFVLPAFQTGAVEANARMAAAIQQSLNRPSVQEVLANKEKIPLLVNPNGELSVGYSALAEPANFREFSLQQLNNPVDREYHPIRCGAGQVVYAVQLPQADGAVVVNAVNDILQDPAQNGAVVLCILADNEFINGANQALRVWEASRDRHYLVGGGTTHVRRVGIRYSDEVVLLNQHTRGGGTRLIYAFMHLYRVEWWQTAFNPGRWITGNNYNVNFYNMNNQQIDNGSIVSNVDVGAVAAGIGGVLISSVILGPIGLVAGAIFTFGVDVHVLSMPEILARGNLRDLRQSLRHATEHPWDALIHNDVHIRTSHSNERIFVRPRNLILAPARQLYSELMAPIFCRVSGLPIIHYENRISTINRAGSRVSKYIENGVVTETLSEEYLLANDIPYYVLNITTSLGTFSTVVFNAGDVYNPDWRFPNGDCANDEIDEVIINTDGESFAAWWDRAGRELAGRGAVGIVTILLIIGGVLAFIFLFPYIAPFLKVILMPWAKMGKKAIVNAKSGITTNAEKFNKGMRDRIERLDNNDKGGFFK